MAKKSPTHVPYNPPTLNPIGTSGIQPTETLTPHEIVEVVLINIDALVFAGVEAGHLVRVKFDATPISVETVTGQRIGDVSPPDAERVRSARNPIGHVVKVEQETQLCVVQVP